MERRGWSREGRRGRGVEEREDKRREFEESRARGEGRSGENGREGRGEEVRGRKK